MSVLTLILAVCHTGVVSFVGESGFTLVPPTGDRIWVYNHSEPRIDAHPGDLLSVFGSSRYNHVSANSIQKLGCRAIPAPSEESISSIASGAADNRLVRTSGVITEAFRDEIDHDWIRLLLEYDSSAVSVIFCDRNTVQQKTFSRLIGQAVMATGIVHPSTLRHRYPGNELLIAGLESLSEIKPFPADRRYPSMKSSRGRVSTVWNGNSYFLTKQNGHPLRVNILPGSGSPQPGDEIIATGFLRHRAFTWLVNATYVQAPPNDTKTEVLEVYTPLDRIITERQLKLSIDGMHVTFEGDVLTILHQSEQSTIIAVSWGARFVPVEIGTNPVAEINSRISVSGDLRIDTDRSDSGSDFVRFEGFTVIAAPNGIRTLHGAPFWTPIKLLSVIAALTLTICGILLWNRTLRHLVERRSTELYRARITGERIRLKFEERNRLAVELHDSISQNLTGADYQIVSYRSALELALPHAQKHLDNAQRILGSCRTELRRCIWDLRNRAIDEPDFGNAIQLTLKPAIGTCRLKLECAIPRRRIDDLTAHALLLIIRELVSNSIRHGHANEITIKGAIKDNCVSVTVSDDGNGFDPSDAPGPREGHFGLSGIGERVRKSGGKFTIASKPGHGSSASITLPAMGQA